MAKGWPSSQNAQRKLDVRILLKSGNHTAAVREFRIVPIAGARAKVKQPFDFTPEIRKPTLESANNFRRLCDSSGAHAGLGERQLCGSPVHFQSGAARQIRQCAQSGPRSTRTAYLMPVFLDRKFNASVDSTGRVL
jgi:hypothetical protein